MGVVVIDNCSKEAFRAHLTGEAAHVIFLVMHYRHRRQYNLFVLITP